MLMIPVSIGELADKLTILRLKQGLLKGEALANVEREQALLQAVLDRDAPLVPEELWHQLQAINGELWQVEDAIRACEARGNFGAAFVALARQVYHLNDRRAQLKRAINLACDSPLIEEKSYAAKSRLSEQVDPGGPPQH